MAIACEIISVICAKEMESDTISAILLLMKMITTSASRNLGMIVGAEPLRDIFLRKIPETNIYISQAPSRGGGFPVLRNR